MDLELEELLAMAMELAPEDRRLLAQLLAERGLTQIGVFRKAAITYPGL